MPTSPSGSVVDALAELHRWNQTCHEELARRIRSAADSGATPDQIAQVLGEPLAHVRAALGELAAHPVPVGAALWA
jgi:hypothetical protein